MESGQQKLFVRIFGILADDQVVSQKQIARSIYKIMLEEGVKPEILHIDDCLVKLNLAEKIYDAIDDRIEILYDE